MRTYLVPRRISDHSNYIMEERRYVRELSEFYREKAREANEADDIELWRSIQEIIGNLETLERSMTNRIEFMEEFANEITRLQHRTTDITEDIRGMLGDIEE